MDRPDWATAPSYAEYAAQSRNGIWHWFDRLPKIYGLSWQADYDSRYCRALAGKPNPDWAETLELRRGAK